MPAFYLTLIAVLLAGLGARDQGTVAGLSLRQGQRPGVLLVALLAAMLTAGCAGVAASYMLAILPPPARPILAGIAVGLAGLESLVLSPKRIPDEPTNSLGALLLVLLAQQVTDAARFIVFGLGVGLAAPMVSGAAGAMAGGVLVAFAWARPDLLGTRAARWTRRVMGGLLTFVALVVFVREFGLV